VTLAGSVAVVTGAGRGIGKAVAMTLAREGASVALASRSPAELRSVADAIGRAGGRACPLQVDVRDAASVDRLVAGTEERLGPIDLLVNNAGTCEGLGPLWIADPTLWWNDVETSLRGAFLCSRAVLPGMTDRRSGRIVNVASYAGTRPAPAMSGYAAAKAALIHLTGTLAEELDDTGVRVFAVAPGTVRTRLTDGMLASPYGHRCLGRIDPDRWLEPERAGELVAYLAGGRADGLSGRLLHVLDDVPSLVEGVEEAGREDPPAVGPSAADLTAPRARPSW
jgi:NAD(P)-dependent dehydrogenase (short-subunit alcohol dehydrogenase family)